MRHAASFPWLGEHVGQALSHEALNPRSSRMARRVLLEAEGGRQSCGRFAHVFAASACMGGMKSISLGQEIRRFRMEAGITLRGFAGRLHVSAAHLSDIEHDRRRPSEALLQRIAHELRRYGATYESLEHLVTGIDAETREWVGSTPGVRKVLQKLRESGRDPLEILRALEKKVRRPARSGKMTATKKAARKKGGRQ